MLKVILTLSKSIILVQMVTHQVILTCSVARYIKLTITSEIYVQISAPKGNKSEATVDNLYIIHSLYLY